MLTSFDGMRSLLPKSPIFFGGASVVFLGLPFGMIVKFNEMGGKGILVLTVITWSSGFIIGVLIKYRVMFSVKFALGMASYCIFLLLFWMGSAVALAFADIAGRHADRNPVLFFYLISIALPLIFGVVNQLVKVNYFKSGRQDDWMRNLKIHVDFDRCIVFSKKNQNFEAPGELSARIWSVGAMVTNIPLLFKIYTGSRNNMVFFLMPLMIGVSAYINVKSVGPHLAYLYMLRKYEKKTGRCFMNADYEEFQKLRRTFFLSRWLMKDYRPATDTPQAG
ncbi:hypothetical protein [Trinickia mobilis]|uniref:hypothetical protein n=1 Tax=Trinickia mobilis TaxID=2816356 RepID=UPI001A901682|nr:hypothetical protein [Trinickia mobilis]